MKKYERTLVEAIAKVELLQEVLRKINKKYTSKRA